MGMTQPIGVTLMKSKFANEKTLTMPENIGGKRMLKLKLKPLTIWA